ncbi:pyridoxal phosphate-dependent transferase [Suillus fuscotomentosus]|uniref:Pyridoxal phosphate-dependent transferase n=1 Tax=Suillus fuscotomentosus TaxID=1912939 RepID=A0AAD4EPH6_9AGAM|nr:pyridoxal phosphate-dependent transferase [Suillus fuscotomentosus]KAG1908419.1 pyridoxal phosphate-dependent transferase [Suillus fuscotomentosus]
MDPKLASIIEQVKVDIITPTQQRDNARQLEEVSRSFISDTITVPTKEMFAYAIQTSLGDDVYNEPSTIALEAHIAKLTGKEAALFVSSGTMGNQLAIRTHLQQPPNSIICDIRAHINKYEAGGAAIHSGALQNALTPKNGHHLTLKDIEPHVVFGTDIHSAPTRIICLENTLDGTIMPQSDIIEIADFALKNGILMHLDGARLWHVAAETRTPIDELCAPFDSVSLCFSKGLGAPVGTCLVGPKEFIQKARWFRKIFGGGMRQTGVLAGSVAYALTHNFSLLPRVHALAKRLQAGLEELQVGILSPAETCMLFYDPSTIGIEYWEIIDRAAALPNPIGLTGSRLVIHIQTSPEAVEDFLSLIKTLKEEKAQAGIVPLAVNSNGMRNVYIRAARSSTPTR